MHGKLGYAQPQNKYYLNQKFFKQVEFVSNSLSQFKGHKVVSVAVGDHHTMVLTQKGEVYVWGGHSDGKRGDDPD